MGSEKTWKETELLDAGMATGSILTVTEVGDQVSTDVLAHPLALRAEETETTLLKPVSASEDQVSVLSSPSAPSSRLVMMRLKQKLVALGKSTHHHFCHAQDRCCAF